MATDFGAEWILYVPAMYVAIFFLIVIIKTIFRNKIKNIESASTAGTGLIPAIVSFCIVCAIPVLGFFGFFAGFPPLIVALMMGASASIFADLMAKYLEKKNRAFFMHIFIINAVLMTLAVSMMFVMYKEKGVNKEVLNPEIHIHADLKVYRDGEQVLLYKPVNIEKNIYTHFHDGENQEDVIHLEGKEGLTLINFLNSIGWDFDFECKTGFIKEGEPIYTYYVNGILSGQSPEQYVVKDLDKLLLVCHGTATEDMIKSVGNNACIQSKKC